MISFFKNGYGKFSLEHSKFDCVAIEQVLILLKFQHSKTIIE